MRAPNPAGTPIDSRRRRAWLRDFAAYRYQISEQHINDWLKQFKRNDRDLAARILDCVEFISHNQIDGAFRALLSGVEGWSPDATKRVGKWRFVPYSGSAGESGDAMLYRFRAANNLNGRQYNELFIYRRDLPSQRLTTDDTVIFVDDFTGTGNNICASWDEMKELIPGSPKTCLFLVAACLKAVKQVNDNTELRCQPHIILQASDNIFSEMCPQFEEGDREKLSTYCKLADPKYPLGYGDCGLLLVFSHTCPNNSIPILHARNNKWEGLFRRYD